MTSLSISFDSSGLGGAGVPYRVGSIYILEEYFEQLLGIN